MANYFKNNIAIKFNGFYEKCVYHQKKLEINKNKPDIIDILNNLKDNLADLKIIHDNPFHNFLEKYS